MSENKTLEKQLEQLGRELADGTDLSQRVMNDIRRRQPGERVVAAPVAPPRQSRWQTVFAVAAALFLAAGIWWLSRPVNLYAQVTAALAEAKTVHMTGWTRHLARKWPLEAPPTSNIANRWPDGKYPIEMWHWTDADGTTRSYERAGPVTLVRQGGNSKEYQEDADLTWIYEGGYAKDRAAEVGGMAAYFSALERPSLKREEIGTREEGGRRLRGLRLTDRGRVEEIWIDQSTNLPVRLTRKTAVDAEPMLELTFTANEPVPQSIVSYTPPTTKNIRYAGGNRTNDAWYQHVAELSQRLEMQPLVDRIALWPRGDGRLFANQWSLPSADGKYWIRPLDLDEHFPLDLSAFIRLTVAREDQETHGTWRMPKEFQELQFPRADIVHVANMPWQEWAQFALGQIGLEFVDQVENKPVWIAKHDGRPLKPWQQTKPPVPYVVEGGKEQKGYVRPGIGHHLRPVTLQELFADFNTMIDKNDFAADKPLIVDQTGLPAPPPYDAAQHGTPREYRDKVVAPFLVATDSPWFVGHESLEMARQWYAREFGITFTEETRPVTVHVIRRKP